MPTKKDSTSMETETQDTTAPQTLQEKLIISRKIYRQKILSKRNNWAPTEPELKILTQTFEKIKQPSKKKKLALVTTIETACKTKVTVGQIGKWFKAEREKLMKSSDDDDYGKNTYKKFSHEELQYLRERFAKNTYPKTEEMKVIAKRLTVSLSKIENWYKHNRRSLAKKGYFILKSKKYFKKEEIDYLTNMFHQHPRPSRDQVIDMARRLECSESQIKNWYSNKRKKQKSNTRRKDSQNIDGGHSANSQSPKDPKDSSSNCSSDNGHKRSFKGQTSNSAIHNHLNHLTNTNGKANINYTTSISLPILNLTSSNSQNKSPIITPKLQPQNAFQNGGFKAFRSMSTNSNTPANGAAEPSKIPSLIIATPTNNSPLFKPLDLNQKVPSIPEIKLPPLKDANGMRSNLTPNSKQSSETCPSFLSSLSSKIQSQQPQQNQSAAQANPSFRLNASAKINADNINKLVSPNHLSQLLASKPTAGSTQANNPSIPSFVDVSNLSSEELLKLKCLKSLLGLDSKESILHQLGFPLMLNNGASSMLQNIPQLNPRLDEPTSVAIPRLNHSIYGKFGSGEKTNFGTRLCEKDVELRKI